MKNSTAFILLLLSVGLTYTFIMPHYDKVMGLRDQAGQYEAILQNVEELKQKREDLQVKYENLPEEEVARLGKVLPGSVDTVSLAMNLDSIAAKYGISIKQIQTVNEANQSSGEIIQDSSSQGYQPATVAFSFVATYPNFRNFMRDIERSLRLIDVQSVSFESTETGLYDFKVTIRTYWLR